MKKTSDFKKKRADINRRLGIKNISWEQIIKCPLCESDHTVREWDENSYSQCTTREMRRCYTKLNSVKAFDRNEYKYYRCPSCDTWREGYKLVIVSDDEKLRRLGGEVITEILEYEE